MFILKGVWRSPVLTYNKRRKEEFPPVKFPTPALPTRFCLTPAFLCAAACLSLYAGPASAVIVYGGNGVDAPANSTPPAGFEDAWNRVGMNGNGTGVYLGNGLVLSARHVGLGSSGATGFVVDGIEYPYIGLTDTTLKNSDNSDADLRLYRIAVAAGTPLFGLEPMGVLENSLTGGATEDGILIGTGFQQVEAQATNIPGEGNGFTWVSTRNKRWAPAEIGASESTPEIPLGNNTFSSDEGFTSQFRFFAGQDGIAAESDSGAPLFYDTGSEIVVAGIVSAVDTAGFAIRNDQTYLSDLAGYDDQIVITLGDLDGDGTVGEGDLDLVLTNYGQSVQAGRYTLGDTDGDGFVGINDLDYVLARWSDGPAPAVVPEPASFLLLSGSLLALVRRRRRD